VTEGFDSDIRLSVVYKNTFFKKTTFTTKASSFISVYKDTVFIKLHLPLRLRLSYLS
jgi:hypothetical protein